MVKHGLPSPLDLEAERETVLALLDALSTAPPGDDLTPLLRRFPRAGGGFYAKSQLVEAYRALVGEGTLTPNPALEQRLLGRPVRTVSGVAPVAVLTEPADCPGECLFCPTQARAPKSYLDGEPGVLRALQYGYDPFAQTAGRIAALAALGHATDKIELLILGGTWSSYPAEYRETFLRRCFDAMNERESATLDEALRRNETAPHRNVGLVIETRPDWVTPAEVAALRRAGVTKVQLGVQSLDDTILTLNRRGHTVEDTRRAIRLLRLAGFKIVVHWMPNLYGATPASDLADFARLWDDPALRPDELKIYPCALLTETPLYDLWQAGQYAPYDEAVLLDLLARCKALVPPYCRINRLMRDIPAGYIVAGTRRSNLRQDVQRRMAEQGLVCRCIRCREIREASDVKREDVKREDVKRETSNVKWEGEENLQLEDWVYETTATTEHFLQLVTAAGRLAGFLRLSLPHAPRAELPELPEIQRAAMIREVHVYGPAQALGRRERGVQHRGLGTRLLDEAARLARAAGFQELAVIAAVGTREYYRARGFTGGELYPVAIL